MTDLPLVDHGYQATELTQCPHAPSDPEWAQWQQDFLDAQTRDPERRAEAERHAHERIKAAGVTVVTRGQRIGPDGPENDAGPSYRMGQFIMSRASIYASPLSGPGTGTGWTHVGYVAVTQTPTEEHQRQRDEARAVAEAFDVPIEIVLKATEFDPETLRTLFGFGDPDPDPEPVHTIRGQPAGRIRTCHHGEPKGSCRDCSRGKR